MYRTLMESLATVPGVRAVGANTTRLFTGGRWDSQITLQGRPAPADGSVPWSFFNAVTPGYFEAWAFRSLWGEISPGTIGAHLDKWLSSIRRSPRSISRGLNLWASSSDKAATFPWAIMPLLRTQVSRVDAEFVVSEMRMMDEQVNRRLANERLLSVLSGGFAVLATILAVVGLHGVLAFIVARRTREIGIPVASARREAASSPWSCTRCW
jgi:hypothetical protein